MIFCSGPSRAHGFLLFLCILCQGFFSLGILIHTQIIVKFGETPGGYKYNINMVNVVELKTAVDIMAGPR